MRIPHGWWALALSLTLSCTSSNKTGDTDAVSDTTDDTAPGAGDDGAGDDTGPPEACYEETTSGCSDISWADIELVIDTLFHFSDTVYGYTEEEATALARTLYDEGVWPDDYLKTVRVQDLGDGRWRAYVVVTNPDGHPATGLTLEDFELKLDDEGPYALDSVSRLGDASDGEARALIPVIVDDSGSMSDCDVNFLIDGLSHLFGTLPPIYEARLLKFTEETVVAQDWTDDGDALAYAMEYTCTDRGSTALWDAVIDGIDAIPEDSTDLQVAVVFTDGLDNSSEHSQSEAVTAGRSRSIPVVTVGMGLADIFALMNLARETRGAFVYIPSGDKILDAFEVLTTFITEAYVVEWTTDGEFVKVTLTATLEGGGTVSESTAQF
jgi:hypothetical protein